MQRLSAALAVFIIGLGVSTYAAEVTGVLVDEACYVKNKANTTNAHQAQGATCAQECAKKGNVVALVTDKGDVYEVMAMGALAGGKNAKLAPHMGETVRLTGMIAGTKDKKMIHATGLKTVLK